MSWSILVKKEIETISDVDFKTSTGYYGEEWHDISTTKDVVEILTEVLSGYKSHEEAYHTAINSDEIKKGQDFFIIEKFTK